MTDDPDERYDALLAASTVLFANGQSTAMTQTALARLNQVARTGCRRRPDVVEAERQPGSGTADLAKRWASY